MRVAAYCGKDWAKAMRASTGIRPATCPPLEAGSKMLYEFLKKAATGDVLALNLHGYAGQTNYYGQVGGVVSSTALTVDDIIPHDWSGVAVFLEVCFSAASEPANQDIPQMFLERGARAVIGSTTEAYGRIRGTLPLPGFDGEADRLLSFWLYFIRRLRNPRLALTLAKRCLRVWSWPLDNEDKETLKSFTMIRRSRDETEMV